MKIELQEAKAMILAGSDAAHKALRGVSQDRYIRKLRLRLQRGDPSNALARINALLKQIEVDEKAAAAAEAEAEAKAKESETAE